jgi:Thiolase, C-terminal domain
LPPAARPSAAPPGLDATSLPVPDRCQRGVLVKDPNQGAELILVKTTGLEFAKAQTLRVVVVDASVDLLWRERLEQIGRSTDAELVRQTGVPLDRMNLHGCSLVYGHPQGPTGARLIVELLHTLWRRGGGVGLFTGCAAGDTGAAVVVRVED